MLKLSPNREIIVMLRPSLHREITAILLIIMYIYHALIHALSAHMIHINLNMIFYTYGKQSYQNSLHKVFFVCFLNALQTHTH